MATNIETAKVDWTQLPFLSKFSNLSQQHEQEQQEQHSSSRRRYHHNDNDNNDALSSDEEYLNERQGRHRHSSRKSKEKQQEYTDSDDQDFENESEADDEYMGVKLGVPPLPDMRFEPVFLSSVRPFLKVSTDDGISLKQANDISSTRTRTTARPAEIMWLDGETKVDHKGLWFSVFKSQVIVQFLTGVVRATLGLLYGDFLVWLYSRQVVKTHKSRPHIYLVGLANTLRTYISKTLNK